MKHRPAAEDAYDPELLQLVRQELVTFAGWPDLSANLHFVEPERLRRHVERLYLGGELSGEARVDGGRLRIRARGLTAWGVRMMFAHEGRDASGSRGPRGRRSPGG